MKKILFQSTTLHCTRDVISIPCLVFYARPFKCWWWWWCCSPSHGCPSAECSSTMLFPTNPTSIHGKNLFLSPKLLPLPRSNFPRQNHKNAVISSFPCITHHFPLFFPGTWCLPNYSSTSTVQSTLSWYRNSSPAFSLFIPNWKKSFFSPKKCIQNW